MNGKIEGRDICSLINATMRYPTWGLFQGLIQEAINVNFPICSFGNSPTHKPNNTLVSVTATSQLHTIIKNHSYVGIDVSVLLVPNTPCRDKTIVIVGESPLRDTKVFNNPNDILLGTPYAVHQEFGCPSQCNVYKKIFSDLLQEGYSIYLTDIIKVWWGGKKGKELKACTTDEQLFKKEMASLNSDYVIVAWGRKAKDNLVKWGYVPIIDLPHPSQQNWNNWKLHIFEKAIYDIKDSCYATNLYPQKKSTTTEVIVANEAVAEILEQIKMNP